MATCGVIAAASAALAATGCGTQSAPADPAPRGAPSSHQGADVSVVASTPVWADIAERVGGDRVEVTGVVPTGADPHDFQASPRDGLAIAEADLLVYNGGGCDPFFRDLADAAGSSAPVIEAYALPVGDGEPGTTRDAQDDNEHVWFDFGTVDAVADAIADDLADIDPGGAGYFRSRADGLHEDLRALAGRADAIAHAGPGSVASTEPVAHYLLLRAGIADRTPPDFGEAVEEGTDPSPADLAAMRRLVSGDGAAANGGAAEAGTAVSDNGAAAVDALIYNTQTDSPTTQAVRTAAQRAHTAIVEVGESPPEGESYTHWTGRILTDLRDAAVR